MYNSHPTTHAEIVSASIARGREAALPGRLSDGAVHASLNDAVLDLLNPAVREDLLSDGGGDHPVHGGASADDEEEREDHEEHHVAGLGWAGFGAGK